MNSLRNKVQLIGNLGADPELKTIANGNKVAKFNLATNEFYRNKAGEKVKETQWHNVVAWGKTAEILGTNLKKGSEIAVEGKLSTRSYTDKQGIKRYFTEVIVNSFTFIGKN